MVDGSLLRNVRCRFWQKKSESGLLYTNGKRGPQAGGNLGKERSWSHKKNDMKSKQKTMASARVNRVLRPLLN